MLTLTLSREGEAEVSLYFLLSPIRSRSAQQIQRYFVSTFLGLIPVGLWPSVSRGVARNAG
jgi:hypothetical protein